jgi:hypothetical protein
LENGKRAPRAPILHRTQDSARQIYVDGGQKGSTAQATYSQRQLGEEQANKSGGNKIKNIDLYELSKGVKSACLSVE